MAFAEAEADIERSGRDNQYIDSDSTRPLSQVSGITLREEETITVKGEAYRTTGLHTAHGTALQAVRESDGVPAIIFESTVDGPNKEKVKQHDVLLQPESMREAPAKKDKARSAESDRSRKEPTTDEIIDDVLGDLITDEPGLKAFLGGKGTRKEAQYENERVSGSIGRLQKRVEERIGRRLLPGAFREVTLSGAAGQAMYRLGKNLGVEVVFFRTTDEVKDGEGYAHEGKIYLRVDTPEPHLFLLGHELLHIIKSSSREHYERFKSAVLAELEHQGTLGLYRRKYRERLKELSLEDMHDEEIDEEFIADVVGSEFMNNEFWENLAKRDTPLFQKVQSWLSGMLNKLTKGSFDSPNFEAFKNLDNIHTALATTIDDFVANSSIKKVGEVKASLGRDLHNELEQKRTFVNTLFERQDEARYQIQRIARNLEKEVQRLAGSKRGRPVGPFAYDRKYADSKAARDLNEAMMIYRDLKINPEKANEFRAWAKRQLRRARGKFRLQIKHQLEVLNRAENLTDKQKEFVDTRMDRAFEKLTQIANAHGVTKSALDHYVRRVWKREDLKRDTDNSSYGFKTFTTASMQRSRETIMDGWMAGDDLAVKGLVNSYQALGEDLTTVVANKRFLQLGMKHGIFTTKDLDGYEKLNAPGFAVWQVRASDAHVTIQYAINTCATELHALTT